MKWMRFGCLCCSHSDKFDWWKHDKCVHQTPQPKMLPSSVRSLAPRSLAPPWSNIPSFFKALRGPSLAEEIGQGEGEKLKQRDILHWDFATHFCEKHQFFLSISLARRQNLQCGAADWGEELTMIRVMIHSIALSKGAHIDATSWWEFLSCARVDNVMECNATRIIVNSSLQSAAPAL